MSLKKYSPEQVKEIAMVELAYELLEEKKQPLTFKDIFDELVGKQGYTKEQAADRIAQFYTDLNIDGRFIALQDGYWGLRKWYPYDQIEEDIATTVVKPKKKKGKKASDDDLDTEGFDDTDDDDFDDLEEYEDDLDEDLDEDDSADDADEDLDVDEDDDDDDEEDFDLEEDLDEDDEDEEDEDEDK
ncbi:DNA-directed RNA polymerase subunit delta [Metabacillus sp. GX 13764]|uniref:DNA-directed RNA polymerase subunit delta n=1 Tax=Metabacillus kandeliae TaxID=2900151 RepID=UPI001E465FD0|nr:DNA-directed RNA polymerase subunit delta [Metabacillus kandeliae]MCD7034699.1 DNA-directed RNA polymerase subunit delta [Metabacillus kandeliae]